MKLQRLYFLLFRSLGAAAILVGFSLVGVFAQGGSGRITPNTTTAKKKTTTTVKKPVTTVKKTTTTASRNVKKPVTAAKNFNYYYSRGQTFYDQKDLVNAIANYTQALRLNPNSADAYYNRGLAYYDSKDYYNAINDYTQSIRIAPAADAYNNRGLAYQYNGNKSQAISDFKAALRLNPQYTRARDNLAKLESGVSDDGDDDEGSAGSGSKNASSTTKTTSAVKNAEYYAELADDQFEAKDFENAIDSYTNLIRLSPRNAAAFVRRGFSYHYTGKVDEAYADYNTAVKFNPDLKNEFYIKCMLYTVDGSNASAVVNDCTRTINEFKTFSLAYYKRGVAYRELNNLESSLSDFTRSIELYPKFFNSVIYRGLIYEAQQKNNQAINEYTSAIRIAGVNSPKAYLAYNNRGVIYEKLGNLSQAEADYRKSVTLNPNFKTAQENLAAIQNKQ